MPRKSPAAVAPTRQDPPRRILSVLTWNILENKDPGKDYVWAWSGHPETGTGRYEALGYDVEVYTAEGVKPGGMRHIKPELLGTPIVRDQHYLMSAPIEVKRSRDAYGETGEGGRELADRLAKRARSKEMVAEALGGLGRSKYGGSFIHAENETSAEMAERG